MTLRQQEIKNGLDQNEHLRICNKCYLQFIAYLGQRKCNACWVGHDFSEWQVDQEERIKEICGEIE